MSYAPREPRIEPSWFDSSKSHDTSWPFVILVPLCCVRNTDNKMIQSSNDWLIARTLSYPKLSQVPLNRQLPLSFNRHQCAFRHWILSSSFHLYQNNYAPKTFTNIKKSQCAHVKADLQNLSIPCTVAAFLTLTSKWNNTNLHREDTCKEDYMQFFCDTALP